MTCWYCINFVDNCKSSFFLGWWGMYCVWKEMDRVVGGRLFGASSVCGERCGVFWLLCVLCSFCMTYWIIDETISPREEIEAKKTRMTLCLLWLCKDLDSIIACTTKSNVTIVCIENIGFVSWAIHSWLHHVVYCFWSVGDIFSDKWPSIASIAHSLGYRPAIVGRMRKISFGEHVVCMCLCDTREDIIECQCWCLCLWSVCVDCIEHLLLSRLWWWRWLRWWFWIGLRWWFWIRLRWWFWIRLRWWFWCRWRLRLGRKWWMDDLRVYDARERGV
jgi:hypothetical protein